MKEILIKEKCRKIGVIADTHLKYGGMLPKKVFDLFSDVDLIIHAGDFTDEIILKELEKIAKVIAVNGNWDELNLPDVCVINISGFRIGLWPGAGSPADILEYVKEQFYGIDLDCIIFGHSHYPLNKKENGVLYFNPGSPTDKYFAPYNSVGILELSDDIKGRIIKI